MFSTTPKTRKPTCSTGQVRINTAEQSVSHHVELNDNHLLSWSLARYKQEQAVEQGKVTDSHLAAEAYFFAHIDDGHLLR
jgi:hypothetical protein